MILYRLLLILCFLFFFSSFQVYSVEQGTEFGSCCYSIQTGLIVDGVQDIDALYYCPLGSVFLGEANAFSCSHYDPLYLKDSVGSCYGYLNDQSSGSLPFYFRGVEVDGRAMYASGENDPSIAIIKDIILNNLSGSFVPSEPVIWYTDSSCTTLLDGSSGSGSDVPINSGGSDAGDSGQIINPYAPSDYDLGSPIPIIPGDNYLPIAEYSNLNRFFSPYNNIFEECSLSSFESLFNSEQACSLIQSNLGESQCFYNPSAMGTLVGSFFSQGNTIVNNQKNSCVPRYSISSCSQYLSQSVCEANPAYGTTNYSSTHPDLSQGCSWISAETSNSFSSAAQGICVSNYVDSTLSGFEKIDYSQRLNVLEDPSFELLQDSPWRGVSSSQLTTNVSYFGENSLYLLPNQILSQEVKGISYKNYVFSLSFLPSDSSLASSYGMRVMVYFKNNSGGTISNQELYLVNGLYDFGERKLSVPLFKRVFFSLLNVPLETHSIVLDIQNTGSNLFYIDALNLEEVSDSGLSYYKPLSIISSSASSCNECFVEGSYNTCTQEKSDSLGSCSYMVGDSSLSYGEEFIATALGKSNRFTLDDMKWESQSLSDSQVFCELYQRRDQCLNTSNSVYSLYGSLCSWNESYGCFKNVYQPELQIPDHIEMRDLLDNSDLSWEQSCDLIAPQVYLELFGRDTDGNFVLFGDSSSPLGDLYLHYQINDVSLDQIEACDSYNLISQVYMNYEIEYLDELGVSKSIQRTFPLSLYNQGSSISELQTMPLSHFLVSNPQSSQISLPLQTIEDQYNIIDKYQVTSFSIEILDQSGNIGYEKKTFSSSFFDFSAPNILLTSHDSVERGDSTIYDLTTTNILLDSAVFNFSASDRNEVNFCDFRLLGGPNSVYDLGWLEVENFVPSNLSLFSIDIRRVIQSTPVFGDFFTMEVRCFDSFGQSSSNKYIDFLVTLNTNVSEFFPTPFPYNYSDIDVSLIPTVTNGFLNSSQEQFYFYTNISSISCNYSLNGIDRGFFGSAQPVTSPFPILKNYSYVVSNNITFVSDGVKDLDLECTSQMGSFSLEHTYIVDTKNPLALSISLDSQSLPTIYTYGGEDYLVIPKNTPKELYSIDGVRLELNPYLMNAEFLIELNGTGSWIEDRFLFRMCSVNQDFLCDYIYENFSYFDLNLSSDTSSSQIYVSEGKFKLPGINGWNLPDLGIPLTPIEEGLYNISFTMYIFDKAGNSYPVSSNFLVDNSSPNFLFSGDIAGVDKQRKLLFSKSINPSIAIDFSAPQYRSFACNASVTRGVVSFTPLTLDGGLPQSSFEFNLGDITQTPIDISTQRHYLTLECADSFGEILSLDHYEIIFDDQAPSFLDVGFTSGDFFTRYLPSPTVELPSISDSFTITLTQPETYGVVCDISLESLNQAYVCSNEIDSSFFVSNSFTKGINLFSMDSRLSQGEEGFSCLTTQNFWNLIPYGEDQIFNATVTCSDRAGNSNSTSTLFSVTHYNSILAEVDFSYSREKAYPSFLSLSDFEAGNVVEFYYVDEFGKEVFLDSMVLPRLKANERFNMTQSFINLSTISGEDRLGIEVKVRLLGETLTTTIDKDTTPPNISLEVLNLDNSELFLSSTTVNFSAHDDFSLLKELGVVIRDLDSNLIESLYTLDGGIQTSSFSSDSYPPNPEDIFSGVSFQIFNLIEGKNYVLEIFAMDAVGFISTKQVEFNVVDSQMYLGGAYPNPLSQNRYGVMEKNPSLNVSISTNKGLICLDSRVVGISNTGIESQSVYQLDLDQNLSFKLPSSLGFGETYSEAKLSFNCLIDGFIPISKIFYLSYDFSGIEINRSYLESTPVAHYYSNNPQMILPSFEDSLKVIFKEDEEYASCGAVFSSNQYYSCNSTPMLFNGFGSFVTSELFMIFDTNLGGDGICKKSSSFALDGVTSRIESQLDITITCNDQKGLNDSYFLEVPVIYTSSELLNVKPEVAGSSLILYVESLLLDQNIHTFNVDLGGVVHNVPYTQVSFEDGIYTYELSSIDISYLDESSSISGNLSLLTNEFETDLRSFSFDYDLTPPEISFEILSFHTMDTIFSNNFDFQVSSVDDVAGVDHLEISLGNLLIFKKNGSSQYINESLIILNTDSLSDPVQLSFRNTFGTFPMNLVFTSQDKLGNRATLAKTINYDDSLKITLLNTTSAVAHPNGISWLSTSKSPTLQFSLTKDVSACYALGIGEFTILDDGTFELDLSSKELTYDSALPIFLNCAYDGKIISFTKYLYYVDTLPDFVVTSEYGFLISERSSPRNFFIDSVAPVYASDLKCAYSFDGQMLESISGGSFLPMHSFNIDFNLTPSGIYSLEVTCKDLLGRIHLIEYDINITQDDPLSLSEFQFHSQGEDAILLLEEGNNQLLASLPYVLEFSSNKIQTSCSFTVLETGFINVIINFFKALFGQEEQEIYPTTPFKFISDELTLATGNYDISLFCTGPQSTTQAYSFNIDVVEPSVSNNLINISYSS